MTMKDETVLLNVTMYAHSVLSFFQEDKGEKL
jgi:hypothetical protein